MIRFDAVYPATTDVAVGPRQSLVVSNAATRLSPPPLAEYCILGVSSNNVRITFDGTTPAALVGIQIVAGSIVRLVGHNVMQSVQLIREAADANVDVEYFGRQLDAVGSFDPLERDAGPGREALRFER